FAGANANTTSNSFTFFTAGGLPAPACPTNAVHHGFLTDWATYGEATTSITLEAQDDIAGFFAATPTAPPPARTTP
ncbi:MAG TPA: hypothetical protein VLW85_21190, partial [Myxococcales bacterium]|nr:hypothetical protein [Myxococcales bacterium]